MSICTNRTVFGQIIIDGKNYDLLSQPLVHQHHIIIQKFKKDHNCGLSTAPWQHNRYYWILEEDKLYLTEVHFVFCKDNSNLIEKIFGVSKLEASWANKELKILINEGPEYEISDNRNMMKRKVMILGFKNGIVSSKKEFEETIPLMRKLKGYIPE